MIYRPFRNSGFKASVIGLGGAALGGDLYDGDEGEALRTLQEAMDAGINFFDTADVYQMGVSELLIGRALRQRRHEAFIATKGGARFTSLGAVALRMRPYLRPAAALLRPFRKRLLRAKMARRRLDHSDAHLTQALNASLRRLGTDYVDLYLLHHPSTATLREARYQETLGRFKREGKTRFTGVSCDSASDALLALGNPELDAIQLEISMLDQQAMAEFLPRAQQQGVAVIARQPLGRGLLTDARTETKAQRLTEGKPDYAQRLQQAAALRFLSNERRSLAQVAIRYLLQIPSIAVVLTGMSSRKHLAENLAAIETPELSASEMARIAEIVRAT